MNIEDFNEDPDNMGRKIITFLFILVAYCYMIYLITK